MHGWLQQCQLYEGKEHPYYGVLWEDATASAGPGFEPLTSARGVAIGDPDDDGDPDLLIVDVDRPPRLLENRSLRDGRWVGVQLVGQWSNREGLGARIEVHAGERTWTREMRTTR